MKKLIPCIYLYQTNAVKGLDDKTVVDTNPVRLAKDFFNKNADGLIVFDMSSNDEEHEEALDIMKEICAEIEIPVYGGGNVHRMEDIKKILYTGCKKAILDYEKTENIDITEEVSLKFGKDKIMVSFQDVNVVKEEKETLSKYVSELILMNSHKLSEALEVVELPMIIQLKQMTLPRFLEVIAMDGVEAITGNAMNDNADDFSTLKKMGEENGISMNLLQAKYKWSDFKLNSDGMLPVVVQDDKTEEVLMVAYMNEESYQKTLQTKKMCYYSRSRQELWLKGETSGHYQYVKSLTADCDMDTLLARVSQVGVACHTGAKSCFFHTVVEREEKIDANPLKVFEDVFNVILDRKKNPKEGSYTNYLFDKGVDKILKKVGEEATEIVIAAKNPNPNEIKYEISDFLYHMMVLMAEKNITWEEITTELANR